MRGTSGFCFCDGPRNQQLPLLLRVRIPPGRPHGTDTHARGRRARDRPETRRAATPAGHRTRIATGRGRGDARLGTWLYRIVYNAALDELERSRRLVQVPVEVPVNFCGNSVSVIGKITPRAANAVALTTIRPTTPTLLIQNW